jgi:hypothetical protein
MKLFIANTTKHNQELLYRVPEMNRVFQQKIKPGEQVLIYQDSPKDVLEYILWQHTNTPKPFCIPEDEAAKHKGFVGLIYSFDKPIRSDKIEGQFEKNDEALVEEGAELRKQSAAAMSQTIDGQAAEMGANVSDFEMSVTEQSRKGSHGESKQLNESISVVKPGKTPGQKAGRGRGKNN